MILLVATINRRSPSRDFPKKSHPSHPLSPSLRPLLLPSCSQTHLSFVSTSSMPPTTHLRGPPDDPHAPWLVQKYGGTSVGKFLQAITREIAPSYLESHRIAIVCSARSGSTKALGTTNLLLQAAKEALSSEVDSPGPSLSNSVASLTQSQSPSTNVDSPTSAATPTRPGSAFHRGNGRSGRGTPARSESKNNVRNLSSSRNSADGSALSLMGKLDALSMAQSGSGSPSMTNGDQSQESASVDPPVGFNATVDRIIFDHLEALKGAVKSEEIRQQVSDDIVDDCERLRDFLMAAKIIEEISPRSQDIIIGVGERLSCRIVVAALQDAGVDAELVTLENIVDSTFLENAGLQGAAEETQLGQGFYDKLAESLGERLRQCSGVPVVTGYFGNVPGSLLSQVGRGYTDLCASLCAVGVKAAELQIWKEVDGVFTADPRKVPTARLIPSITPEEAAELTYYGSEVIHPFTMEQAIKKSVPIRIKNVQNPKGGGTVIFPDEISQDGSNPNEGQLVHPLELGTGKNAWGTNFPKFADASSTTPGGSIVKESERKLPTAVTIKDDVLVLNVHSNRKTISHGFFARIFGTLDRHGVIVDLISTSEVHVSMAISTSSLPPAGTGPRARVLNRVIAELEPVGTVSVLRDMAILSLVGKRMRHMVGVAGKMFSTLAEGNVNIEMISQGANEINISCVIHESMALKALNLIHYSVLEVSPRPKNLESGSFGRSFF